MKPCKLFGVRRDGAVRKGVCAMNTGRFKNTEWPLPTTADGRILTWEYVPIALLMDLRDELKSLNVHMANMNQVIQCPNFIAIPQILKRISTNTAKPRKRKKA